MTLLLNGRDSLFECVKSPLPTCSYICILHFISMLSLLFLLIIVFFLFYLFIYFILFYFILFYFIYLFFFYVYSFAYSCHYLLYACARKKERKNPSRTCKHLGLVKIVLWLMENDGLCEFKMFGSTDDDLCAII